MAPDAPYRLKTVSSRENPRYKALQRLVQSAPARRKSGLSVLDGAHLVAAYRRRWGLPQQLIVSRSGWDDPEIRELMDGAPDSGRVLLDDVLFRHLSSVTTPTGVMAVIRTPRPQPVPRDMDACVMLEDVQDPGNVGSILRSCAAAGIGHVLLSAGSAHAWAPRVLRAGMGAHFALSVYEAADLEAVARAFRGKRIATRQRAPQSVFDAELGGSVALMFGNEGAGLSRGLLSLADAVVSVPMPGAVESLNIAAAAAVCLFERVRQLSAGRGRSQSGLRSG